MHYAQTSSVHPASLVSAEEMKLMTTLVWYMASDMSNIHKKSWTLCPIYTLVQKFEKCTHVDVELNNRES